MYAFIVIPCFAYEKSFGTGSSKRAIEAMVAHRDLQQQHSEVENVSASSVQTQGEEHSLLVILYLFVISLLKLFLYLIVIYVSKKTMNIGISSSFSSIFEQKSPAQK